MCIPEAEVIRKDFFHILEIYRASLLHPPVDRKNHSGKTETYGQAGLEYQIIPQATELRDSRIQFKKGPTNSLRDVSFDPKQGELKLPYLVVDDDNETTLLNVMAFEKLHVNAGSQVTFFVILMVNLIHEDQDVAVLASNKILANALGNDQNAANLFGLLGKGVAMDLDSHIADVYYKVNQHCSQPWNQWWASLKPDYLQHKWALISVLAATFGFVLIILQLAYQIADYNRRN